MQTNIFSLIDQLVSMSGSTTNYDTLESELSIIDSELPKINEEIKNIESSMTEEKYFDATQEIVDRNIELSVSKKLVKLEKCFESLQNEQKELEIKLHQLNEAKDALNQKCAKCEKSRDIIEDRIKNSTDEKTKKIYSNLLDEEMDNITAIKGKLEEKNALYSNIAAELEKTAEKVEKIQNEIEISTSRLLEVRKNLSSKKNYIDESLKDSDEAQYASLKDKLQELESKRLAILTNANYIASEVKELFIAEENDAAMKKLLELVTIVNSRPYMEINDKDVLRTELEKLEASQNDLIGLIESKKYFGNDVFYLDNRIKHLHTCIETKKREIEVIKNKINEIDNVMVTSIVAEMKKAEIEAEKLEKSINYYEEMLKSLENKNNNKKVSLQASYNKKKNELRVIKDIITRYSNELELLVTTSSKLEGQKIGELNNDIACYMNEIEELTKIKLLSTKTKDTIEQEKDKKKLNEINENIKMLQDRLGYQKTAQEIYDEIEMNISTEKNTQSKTVYEEIEEPINNYNDEIINNNRELMVELDKELNDDVESNDEEFVNPIEENKPIEHSLNENINLIEEENNFQLPLIDDNFNNFENDQNNEVNELPNNEVKPLAFDVVSEPDVKNNDIVETTSNNESNDESEEYTFSELEDTDYFSLDSFLKGLEEEK